MFKAVDQTPLVEKILYHVFDGPVSELESALSEWAKSGYYPASAPQVYQNDVTYVLVILELDERRWKLES
jgi:hypothetical protein